jgi:hypothetical protein
MSSKPSKILEKNTYQNSGRCPTFLQVVIESEPGDICSKSGFFTHFKVNTSLYNIKRLCIYSTGLSFYLGTEKFCISRNIFQLNDITCVKYNRLLITGIVSYPSHLFYQIRVIKHQLNSVISGTDICNVECSLVVFFRWFP